jgi:SAM-dependent methyltransferase
MNFRKRSYTKELLDRDDIPFADIKQNMQELDLINAKLEDIRLPSRNRNNDNKDGERQKGKHEKLSVLEIGCGGGDNLRVIKNYCAKKNIAVQLSGLDINPHCIAFARSRKENEGIEFISSDYKLANPFPKPDIIFNSLFCHHFADDEMRNILIWMKEHSASGSLLTIYIVIQLLTILLNGLRGYFRKAIW